MASMRSCGAVGSRTTWIRRRKESFSTTKMGRGDVAIGMILRSYFLSLWERIEVRANVAKLPSPMPSPASGRGGIPLSALSCRWFRIDLQSLQESRQHVVGADEHRECHSLPLAEMLSQIGKYFVGYCDVG